MSSIPLLNTNTTILVRMAKALWNVAPGYSILQNYVSYANSNGINATVNALGDFFSTLSNSALAARICTNLGMTGDAYTAGVAYLEGQFNANTLANRGKVVSDAMTLLSQQTSNAVLSTVATQFNAAVLNAETYSSNSANTSVSTTAAAAGGDLTTTAGETITGTAGNDTFGGITMLTLQDGDIVIGGAGTDTLNIQARGTGNDILTTLSGVEIVNIDMRSAQTFDTALWSGVTNVSVVADSAANTTLTISNARSFDTEFKLNKVGSLQVGWEDTGGVNTANFGINSLTTGTVAIGFGGGVERAQLSVSGTNAPTTIAMSATNLATVTVVGSGSVGTIDFGGASITGVSFAGFTGAANARVSADTALAFTGNDSNNTLTIGVATTLSSGDVLNGGLGTDTLTLANQTSTTLGLSGTSNFEVLNLNASGAAGTFTFVNSKQFDRINITEASASTDFVFSNASGGQIFDIRADYSATAGSNSDFTFNYTGTVATTEVADIRFTSGGVGGNIDVSGADEVRISHIASADSSVSLVNVNSGTEVVSLSVGGSGDMTVGRLMVSGRTEVRLGASGDAALTVSSVEGNTTTSFEKLAVTTFTVDASGPSAAVDVNGGNYGGVSAIYGNSLSLISITGGGSADIELSSFDIEQDSNLDVTVRLTGDAGLGSPTEGLDININTSGTLTYSVTVGSGDVYASAINAGSLGHIDALTIDIQGNGGSFQAGNAGAVASRIGPVTLTAAASSTMSTGALDGVVSIGAISVTHASSGTVSIGAIDASGISTLSVSAGGESLISLGDMVASNSVGQVTGTLGRSASLTIGAIELSSSTRGITGIAGVEISSIGVSASFTLGTATSMGSGNSAQASIGVIYASGGLASDISLDGGVSAMGDIGAITLIVGTSGTITVGTSTDDVESQEGTIGNVNLQAGAGGAISLSGLRASAENIGNLTVAGGSAFTLSGGILASGSIGNISITSDRASFGVNEIEARSIGTVRVEADGASISFTAGNASDAFSVGAITIDASAVTMDFGSANGAATIASISVNGSGTNIIDVGSAAAVTGGITVLGSGLTVLDLSQLVAGTVVSAGASANHIQIGAQGGRITLQDQIGTDRIILTSGTISPSTVASGAIVTNFNFSGTTRQDSIYLGGTASWGLVSAIGHASAASDGGALSVALVSASSLTLATKVEAGTTSALPAIVVLGTATVDVSTIASALKEIGALLSNGSQVIASAANIGVMFYNNQSAMTQLWLVDASTTIGNTFTATNTSVDHDLLLRFEGDIRTFSGSTFANMFFTDGN